MKKVAYIYAIKARQHLKIGYSVNLAQRFRAMQLAHAEVLRLYDAWTVDSSTVRESERRTHDALRPFRVRGEWFHHVAQIDDAITIAIDVSAVAPYRLSLIDDRRELLRHTGVTPLVWSAPKT